MYILNLNIVVFGIDGDVIIVGLNVRISNKNFGGLFYVNIIGVRVICISCDIYFYYI